MSTTTTEQTTTTATTVVVNGDSLARILGNAALACDTTKSLPVLGAVRIELAGGTLTAIATDRYRLHTDTLAVDGDDVAATQLDRIDVAAIVKLIKGSPSVALTFEGDTVAVRTHNATATYSSMEGTFPAWQRLLPEHADTGAGTAFALNPRFLAAFAKVVPTGERGKLSPLRIQMTAADKPARVEIGDTFVGLLMTVRLPEHASR